MLLYHGTSGTNLQNILENGICPRGDSEGNWAKQNMSMPEFVYLSDSVAPYFAMYCQKEDNNALVLEINTDYLKEFNMFPDEDFFRCTNISNLPNKEDFDAWTDYLFKYQDKWELSLNKIGTCSHFGKIPIQAITRYAIINPSMLHLSRADISIGIFRGQTKELNNLFEILL